MKIIIHSRFRLLLWLPVVLVVLSCSDNANQPYADSTPDPAPVGRSPGGPPDQPAFMNVSMAAKRLCSALFVSNREEAEAFANSAGNWLEAPALDAIDRGELVFESDVDAQRVDARWGSRTATALFTIDQGCVILPEGGTEVFFTPVPVVSDLAPAASTDWPMGDVGAQATDEDFVRWGVDRSALEAAVAISFAYAEDATAAFLVVHDGKIAAESYAAGAHRDMQLESWSMGKTITSALVGRLMQLGHLDLDDPANIPSWQSMPDDPRNAITLRQLLNMSSGLRMTHPYEPETLHLSAITGWADHSLAYGMAVHTFAWCESRPLEFAPGTVGRYRNCDPLLAGSIVRRTLENIGENYLTWPQRELFDRIGIRRQVLETDVYGNFVLTGFDYGTGRNWARLGLLFLQRGQWQGEQLLPADFVDFVAAPAPAWEDGGYGGLVRRNHPAFPEDSYHMNGGGGQQVAIVPSLNLVIVRLGHSIGFPRNVQTESSARRTESMRAIADLFAASSALD